MQEFSYQAVPIHDRGAVPAGAQDAALEHLGVIAAKRNICQMQKPFPPEPKQHLFIAAQLQVLWQLPCRDKALQRQVGKDSFRLLAECKSSRSSSNSQLRQLMISVNQFVSSE